MFFKIAPIAGKMIQTIEVGAGKLGEKFFARRCHVKAGLVKFAIHGLSKSKFDFRVFKTDELVMNGMGHFVQQHTFTGINSGLMQFC